MDLYLIRHGETVDNVAGLYAGVRDSALTNHGTEQARRLGKFFADEHVNFTHIFASPLSRALKTAEAISVAQRKSVDGASGAPSDTAVAVVQVPDLIEQNFGFYEGKSFHSRSDPKKLGREAHTEKHKNDVGFEEAESKAAMDKRADAFLDDHLLPLLQFPLDESKRLVVAVVSHGMLLSRLWKRFLIRLPAKSVSIAPEVTAARGNVILEHPGGWSNTGYLQLCLARTVASVASNVEDGSDAAGPSVKTQATPTKSGDRLFGWSAVIMGIDRKAHLTGLKRQRGGIGSLAFDSGQSKLDGFFKRPRKA